MRREIFRPISHTGPNHFLNTIKFYARIFVDFQVLTVYINLRNFLKEKNGKILDVGCGASPYRHLFKNDANYLGIDINTQDNFDYSNKEIIFFKNNDIPLKEETIDHIICTEVFEHVLKPHHLVTEIRRVLKKNGEAFITIPWSARYHYIPYDYFRFTEAALENLFQEFNTIKIYPRGSDLTTISSKIIVVCMRWVYPITPFKLILCPITLCFIFPLMSLSISLGHISFWLNLGSKDDPLGYTIYLKK